MAYIGKQPTVGNFVKLDTITTSATATYNLLNGGVAYSPQSANHCIVCLNGVIQSPNTSFTISGSTIVFASALTATDVIDFILVLGDVLNIGTPSDATVGFSKITSNLITGATAETTIAGGDQILIYDDSATALRKMTRTNFVAGIGATAGQVIQVVSSDENTSFSTTSTSFVNSNIEVSITPSSASNKIFIMATVNGSTASSSSAWVGTIFRDSTNLASGSGILQQSFSHLHVNTAGDLQIGTSLSYLDSPSTTSSTTYSIRIASYTGNSISVNANSQHSTITLFEIKG